MLEKKSRFRIYLKQTKKPMSIGPACDHEIKKVGARSDFPEDQKPTRLTLPRAMGSSDLACLPKVYTYVPIFLCTPITRQN